MATRVTIVDGSTYVGTLASDGSVNVVVNTSPSTRLPVYHASGALNVVLSHDFTQGLYHPSGAYRAVDLGGGVYSFGMFFSGFGSGYDTDAATVMSRMTVPPTKPRSNIINTFVNSLKSAGVWTKLDALYVMAAADSQAAKLNWVANQFNLTETAAPTFTVDRGYAGNGTTSYLQTGAAPSALTKYLQNDAHHSVFVRGAPTTGLFGRTTTSIPNLLQESAGTIMARINSVGGAAVAYTPATNNDFVSSRSSSTGFPLYQNGVSIGTVTATSAAKDTEALTILRAGTAFATAQVSIVSFGSSLSAAEALAFYNAKVAYLQSVGAV